jgi:inorganic pyrophosphatase
LELTFYKITPYPLIHDSVVTVRPIGVLRMTDEAGRDYKILAVPTDKLCKSYHDIKCIDDIHVTLKAQIELSFCRTTRYLIGAFIIPYFF